MAVYDMMAQAGVADRVWRGRGFSTGTNYVPNTGIYKLHEGETVVPQSRRNSVGGSGKLKVEIGDITVNARLTQDVDVRGLGSKIGEAIASEIISGIESEFEVG